MALTTITSAPFISASVYKNGIKSNILDANGSSTTRLCVCLLDAASNIIAYSAYLNCATGTVTAGTSKETAEFFNADFKWNDSEKKLTIPAIPYTVTKNADNVSSSGSQASRFALISVDVSDESLISGEEAFTGSGYYKFPNPKKVTGFNDSNVLIIGNISSTPTINQNSNFRLTETTITFSEQSAS